MHLIACHAMTRSRAVLVALVLIAITALPAAVRIDDESSKAAGAAAKKAETDHVRLRDEPSYVAIVGGNAVTDNMPPLVDDDLSHASILEYPSGTNSSAASIGVRTVSDAVAAPVLAEGANLVDNIGMNIEKGVSYDTAAIQWSPSALLGNSWHYPILIVALIWLHVYVYRRDNPKATMAIVYVIYISLHSASSTLQILVGKAEKDMVATAQAVVFAALLIKLTISLVLVCAESVRDHMAGEFSWKRFSELFVVCLFSVFVPSMLYTSSDLLLLYCQSHMTMTEVQVIAKIAIPITAVVWYVIFKISIGKQKICGLLVLMLGTGIYAVAQQSQMKGSKGTPELPAFLHLGNLPPVWIFRLFMLCQAIMAVFGGVTNEYFLLKCGASTNMMNSAMYIEGLLFVMAQTYAMGKPFPVAKMITFTPLQWTLATTYAAMGICTSYFLRYLGSIWKQVAYGVMMLTFFSIDNLFFKHVYSDMAVFGVIVVTVGIGIYIIAGIEEDNREKAINGVAEEPPKEAATKESVVPTKRDSLKSLMSRDSDVRNLQES
jgi:hypothetical protein